MEKNRKCDNFFAKQEALGLALGFNDIRLKTGYSEVLPSQVSLLSKFSRNINLNIPIVSSPMDTVTEAKMAIAMAKAGGIGIIHKGLSPIDQASAIAKVKHNLSAFISDPICVKASDKVADVLRMKKEKDYKFSSFPVLNDEGILVGIVTGNDFEFCDNSEKRTISDIMSKDVIGSKSGTKIEDAYSKMIKRHKKILPIFSPGKKLEGIYTWADVKRIVTNDAVGYNLDAKGSLRVGAAIGIGNNDRERVALLAAKGVDVLILDTAHGDTAAMLSMIAYLKSNYEDIDVVAGNVSESTSVMRLIKAGVDGIRVGQGPGSICTTRIISGIGHPQVSAVYECAKAARGSGVPVCADGGIAYSGDITIALAAGADSIMLGKLLAGTTESPGEINYRDGKALKVYRGMGSLEAMIDNKASRERYGQTADTSDKLVPEGVKGQVAFKGEVFNVLFQLLGGLRSGMGYTGSSDINMLHEKADFYRISSSGLSESHPHGLEYMEESPNYRR